MPNRILGACCAAAAATRSGCDIGRVGKRETQQATLLRNQVCRRERSLRLSPNAGEVCRNLRVQVPARKGRTSYDSPLYLMHLGDSVWPHGSIAFLGSCHLRIGPTREKKQNESSYSLVSRSSPVRVSARPHSLGVGFALVIKRFTVRSSMGQRVWLRLTGPGCVVMRGWATSRCTLWSSIVLAPLAAAATPVG